MFLADDDGDSIGLPVCFTYVLFAYIHSRRGAALAVATTEIKPQAYLSHPALPTQPVQLAQTPQFAPQQPGAVYQQYQQ
jgi:hypothetical protein